MHDALVWTIVGSPSFYSQYCIFQPSQQQQSNLQKPDLNNNKNKNKKCQVKKNKQKQKKKKKYDRNIDNQQYIKKIRQFILETRQI